MLGLFSLNDLVLRLNVRIRMSVVKLICSGYLEAVFHGRITLLLIMFLNCATCTAHFLNLISLAFTKCFNNYRGIGFVICTSVACSRIVQQEQNQRKGILYRHERNGCMPTLASFYVKGVRLNF